MAAPTASKDFSALTSLTTAAADDELFISDTSEAVATNKPKRITTENLKKLITSPRGAFIVAATGANQTVPTATFTKVLFTDAAGGATLFDTDNAADRANSRIIIPSWAHWINVLGHIEYVTQTNASAVTAGCNVHLFRNDGPTPEAHYHNIMPYIKDLPVNTSMTATTGWIPIVSPSESWTLIARQTSGQSTTIVCADVACWLNIEFAY